MSVTLPGFTKTAAFDVGTPGTVDALNTGQGAAVAIVEGTKAIEKPRITTAASTVTGTQNDYDVDALAVAPSVGTGILNWSGASAVTFNGFAGGLPGRMLLVKNSSAAQTLTIVSQATGSIAANRCDGPVAGLVLGPRGCACLWYDGVASRWIVDVLNLGEGTVSFVGGLTVGGLLAVSGFGQHNFVSSGTGANRLQLTNSAAGTGNNVLFRGDTDVAEAVYMRGTSSTYTASGATPQAGAEFGSSGAGGVSLAAVHASGTLRFYANGSTLRGKVNAGWEIGAPTGGDKGAGTMNFAADIYKNNTAYDNPDYVLEHWATGKIVRFKANDGADRYDGLRPLASVERFVRRRLVLPRIEEARRAAGKSGLGAFGGGDAVLATLEEAYLYLFQQEARIRALEEKLKRVA